VQAELVELRAQFEPGAATEIRFKVRGVNLSYDAKKQEIVVNAHHAPAPLHNGKMDLIVYADRTSLEIIAASGLTYVPFPINLDPKELSLSAVADGGPATISALEVYQLKSIWPRF